MTRFSMARPLYWFALVCFFTCFTLVKTDERYALAIAVTAAVVLLLTLCVPMLRKVHALTVIFCAVLLGSLLVYVRFCMVAQPLKVFEDASERLTMRVEQVPQGDSKLYRVCVAEDDALPVGTTLAVSFANTETELSVHDVIEAEVSLFSPPEQLEYLRAEDVFMLGYVQGNVTVEPGSAPWYERLATRLRTNMLDGIYAACPDEQGDLLAAVCLGERASLSVSMEKDFRQSGLLHLLVVSGLHMSVLTGSLLAVLRCLRVHKRLSALIALAVLWLFMLMVGFTYSVIRAAVMLHFLIIGQSLRVRADARTSMAAALLLILLQNPYAAADVGFLLSFAATLGLVVLVPPVQTYCQTAPLLCEHPWLGKLLLAFWTPIAAMIFTAPVLACAFGMLSMLSPLANVLAGGATAVMLCMGMLGAVASCVPFLRVISAPVLYAAGLIGKWVLWVAEKVADVAVMQLQIRHVAVLLVIILIPVAVYWSGKLLGVRGVGRASVIGLATVLLCVGALEITARKTYFLRVDATDGSLAAVVENGESAVAIMGGEDYDACMAAYRFFSACRVGRFDALVILNGDTAITPVLSEMLSELSVETVIYPQADMDFTAGVDIDNRQSVENEVSLSLGSDITLSRKDDWWRVTAKDTRILIAPANGNVDTLPKDWRRAHVSILCGEVPKAVRLLDTRRAVALCAPQNVGYITAQLPWGEYPIHLSAIDGKTVLSTAGNGDVVAVNQYFL